ncbi:JmjC domain-containing protein [Pseudomonas lopnurensis]|uniref:JmjC domain-containing protein n=1 Tax=Pseudomonas lopnurensis TaxID=1477517 RepID=UPI001F1778F9|nr:cupin domain-containing protein [Pseudomonas lopnurensis]
MKVAVSSNDFSWRDANEIFERSNVASNDFKLSCDGIRPKHEYVESYWDIGTLRHRLIKPVVYDYLRNGATLIANKIANEPKVNQFARRVAEFTGRQVVSSAYAAFGERDSFRCHWDTRDVFAIQLIGRKRWIVYEPSFEAPLFTQQSRDYEHQYPCPAEPYMDFILEAGDVFYLPRGWWHNPLPLGEETFHLALGTFPAYTMDYLGWAMKHMPDFLDARRSLSRWEDARGTLASVGRHLDAFINDPQNYDRFLNEFIGNTRVESPLAIDLFGNPNAGQLAEDARLQLSANKPHGLDERYVIANGTRLNLDDQGERLIRRIAERPGISLAELSVHCPEADAGKLRELVTALCRQDVLELSAH